jgi:succinate dehydrogenase hydrophobic membrane anchor protein
MITAGEHARQRALRLARLAVAARHGGDHPLYTLLVIGIVMWHGGLDYRVWKAVFASGAFRLATFLFMMAVLFHAWVGVRNIAMDYSKPTGIRLAFQMRRDLRADRYAGWTIQLLWVRRESRQALPVRKFDAVSVGAVARHARVAAARRGRLSVAVLSKVFPTRSHTVAAQGGIGASLGNMGEDNWLWHMYDTIKGSDWLGDQDAIEYMCRDGAAGRLRARAFRDAVRPQRRTARSTSGRSAATRRTSARSRSPACAAADRTGHAMLHTLYQRNVRARPSSSSSGWRST